MSITTKQLPSRAFRVPAGAFEFAADAPPTEAAANGLPRGKIKLTASSGQVFNHRWWGPIVFDYAGLTWSRDRLAIDWCHEQDEILGYADQIDTTGGKLTVSGELISVCAEDRAAQVLALGQAGVPFEASIQFDPVNGLLLEEYQAGMTAAVNGQQLAGPLTVVRKCLLRGVAVCGKGADPYTESEFSATDGDVTVTLHLQESEMSETTPPADVLDTKPVVTSDQLRAELAAQLADFTTRFGAELGAQWTAAGKPVLDCYTDFVAAMKTQHAAAISELQGRLDGQSAAVTELQSRLDSLSIGEKKPVSTTPADADPAGQAAEKFAGRLTPGMSMFAAGLKQPAQKTN